MASQEDVILVDGECVACNGFARFVMNRDDGRFLFGSQKSKGGRKLLDSYGVEVNESIILIDDGEIYTASGAVIRILSYLSGIWRVFELLLVLPKPIRDFFYAIFSRYRYQIFGKKDTCYIDFGEDRLIK